MKFNQLVIGTANFGNKYGIDNFQANFFSISKMFNFMNTNKINFLDTALDYKNCDSVLGKIKLNKFNVITKIGKIPKKNKEIEKWIFKKVLLSKKKLRISQFYGILIHNSEMILGSNGQVLYESLKKLKNLKITKKIGFSSYDTKITKKILNVYKFDIIQLPVNYLDRRFLEKKFISLVKKKKLEIHARSIFLQGTLLKNYKLLPSYLRKWKKVWENFEKLTLNNGVSKFQMCMLFMQNLIKRGIINKIIIGLNNEQQLREIINFVNAKKRINIDFKQINSSKNLIDPRRWNYAKKN